MLAEAQTIPEAENCLQVRCMTTEELGEDYHRSRVLLTKEHDGQLSARIAELPGVASCGSNEREAIDNIQEALDAALETYRDVGQAIPWAAQASEPRPDEYERWIVVVINAATALVT